MAYKTRQSLKIEIREYEKKFGKNLSGEQLALITGVSTRLIQRLVSLELIECSEQNEFSIELIPEIRRLFRLHNDLGVSWSSMGLVIDLLERIDELEEKLNSPEN